MKVVLRVVFHRMRYLVEEMRDGSAVEEAFEAARVSQIVPSHSGDSEHSETDRTFRQHLLGKVSRTDFFTKPVHVVLFH